MSQTVTTAKPQPTVEPYKQGIFDEYVTFCALGGVITTDDGHYSKMSLQEFCATYDVERRTTYRWKRMPNFNELVRQRRDEVVPLSRETAVFNSMYIIALQHGDKRAAVEAGKLFLGHFSNLQLPVQRQDVKIQGGIADLLNTARERRLQEAQEGEVIDVSSTDA